MPRKHLSQIQADEHATIGGVDAKKVFVIDNSANQITDFGGDKLPIAGNNPEFVLTDDGNGNLVQVDQIIDGVTYSKSLTWSSNSLVSVSKWA